MPLCSSFHFLPCYWLVVIFTFKDIFPLQLPPLAFAFLASFHIPFIFLTLSFFPCSLCCSREAGVPGPLHEHCSELLSGSDCARTEALGLQLRKLGRRQHQEVTNHTFSLQDLKGPSLLRRSFKNMKTSTGPNNTASFLRHFQSSTYSLASHFILRSYCPLPPEKDHVCHHLDKGSPL